MPLNFHAPALALVQGLQIGQVLLLLLYLALIFAGVYFLTRFLGRVMQHGTILPTKAGGRKYRTQRHIRLVDRLTLDREKSIVLLEADGKRYLLGVSEHAFTLLETSDAPLPEAEDNVPQGRSFRDIFSAWKRQEGDGHAPQE